MSTTATTTTPITPSRPFTDLRRDDVQYAGGKGANLGELTAAGLPVPPGFVVGAPAYAAFVRGDRAAGASGLPARRRRRGGHRRARKRHGQGARAGGGGPDARPARARPCATPMPRSAPGGDAAVAVRSSATAEDTDSASFAGMNETFLNVRGADAVVDAVRRCWALAVRRAHRVLPRQARLRRRPTWTSPSSCSARSPRPAPA